MSDIVVFQRVLANYREGFFDLLSEKIDYNLICSDKSSGKITAPKNLKKKKYVYVPTTIQVSNYIIFFPFLFFSLYSQRPKYIITEGGQNTINNVFVWLYCKFFKCEYIIWDLGKAFIKKKNNNFIRKLYIKLYDFILNDAEKIYTYNDVGVEYFRIQGIKKDIIPLKNTVDTRKVLQAISGYEDSLQKIVNNRFNKYKYHLLFVGALNENKRLEDFQRLMNLLSVEYGLIIVGTGNDEYVKKLRSLLDDERIYFEGYKNMDQLQYYYNKVDCLFLPGLGGLSINQAMAFGTAVICSEADGIEKELILDGETGYLYKTIEDAVQFIEEKFKDDWIKMGNQAKEIIFEDYTVEKMVDRFISNISSLDDIVY